MEELKQLRDMKIATFDAGFRSLLKKLISEGFRTKNILPINNNRYILIFGMNGENIMVTYKRDPFYNFGIMFRKEGFKGVGDSINCEDLRKAIQNNIKDIYTIFPNGYAYKISLKDFLMKSIHWTNKEGKEVRSISIHELKKVYDLSEKDDKGN